MCDCVFDYTQMVWKRKVLASPKGVIKKTNRRTEIETTILYSVIADYNPLCLSKLVQSKDFFFKKTDKDSEWEVKITN